MSVDWDLSLVSLLLGLGDVAFVVPLAVEEVGEAAAADVDQLVEDGGDDCAVMDLEVHAGVRTQTHQLLQDEASAALEDGVNH